MSHRRLLVAVPIATAALVFAAQAQAAPPGNDAFGLAQTIAGPSLNVNGSTIEATEEAGEPNHAGTTESDRSVWYSWTSPSTGTVKLDTCGSGLDTMIGVYTGAAVNVLTERTSNDDAHNPPCSDASFSSRTRFRAEATITYKIAVDSYDPGAFDLQLDLVTPPANDDFANGQDLTGTPVTATGNTNNASRETDEPLHVAGQRGGASIWFDWVAPSTGAFRIDTCGSDFNTNLAIYTGNALNALTPVPGGSNADSCGQQSKVLVNLAAATTYRIAVDGATNSPFIFTRGDPKTGSVALNIKVLNPPANDNFSNATAVSGFFTQPGTVEDSGSEAGEPVPLGASVWYSWTAPAAGQFSVSSCESSTEVDVFTGAPLNALAVHPATESSCAGGQRQTFAATMGTIYSIRVRDAGGATDTFELRMRGASVPPNDELAGATTLTGPEPTIADDNIAATAEADVLGAPFPTVWYSWTPPVPGDYRFSACESNFKAQPVVHLGDTTSSLEDLTEEVNPCPGNKGSYTETFADGTEPLRIAVAGLAEQGEFTLEITKFDRPANDDFADAASLSGNVDSDAGTTADASVQESEPNSENLVSTWHKWVAPSTGEYKLSTCGSETPTALAVFTGEEVAALTTIRHLGGGVCGQGSTPGDKAVVDTVAGQTYRIQLVSGDGADDEGAYTLEPQRIAPANDAPDTAIDEITVKKKTATATFSGTDDGTGLTFECNLDNKGWKDCVSPQKFKRLTRGTHSLAVRAIDSEGKLDRTPAADTFKVKTN